METDIYKYEPNLFEIYVFSDGSEYLSRRSRNDNSYLQKIL